MPIRRLTPAALVAALIAIVAFVASAHAQFPGAGAKIPTVGKKAATAAKAEPPKTSGPDCAQFDETSIDKFIKAEEVWKKVYNAEVATANAKKAEADALATKRGTLMMNTTIKTDECKDAFKEKDPRTREASRLEVLVAAADDSGDQAKSDELRKKLDPLNSALDLDADRACGGKGTAALHDCLERKTAELKKQGLAGPMLQIQAQGECMSDPTTSGVAGLSGPSAEEQAATTAYQDGMSNARSKADQAKKDALGSEDQERPHAIFIECCIGVLKNDPVIMSHTSPEFREAIRTREGRLEGICR